MKGEYQEALYCVSKYISEKPRIRLAFESDFADIFVYWYNHYPKQHKDIDDIRQIATNAAREFFQKL